MRRIILALAFTVIGCGSTEPAPEATPDAAAPLSSQLVGKWTRQINDTAAERLIFDGTNFEDDIVAQLTDGTFGMEIDQGTYSVTTTGKVAMKLTMSSCQGVKPITNTSQTWTVTREGTALTVNTGTQFITYQLKTDPPTGTGSAKIGCMMSDGFTAHASAPVPQ